MITGPPWLLRNVCAVQRQAPHANRKNGLLPVHENAQVHLAAHVQALHEQHLLTLAAFSTSCTHKTQTTVRALLGGGAKNESTSAVHTLFGDKCLAQHLFSQGFGLTRTVSARMCAAAESPVRVHWLLPCHNVHTTLESVCEGAKSASSSKNLRLDDHIGMLCEKGRIVPAIPAMQRNRCKRHTSNIDERHGGRARRRCQSDSILSVT